MRICVYCVGIHPVRGMEEVKHDLSTHNWLGDWKPHLYLLCRICGTSLLASDGTILEGHSVTEEDVRAFAKKLGSVPFFDQPIKPEHYDVIDDPSCVICGTDTRNTEGAFFIDVPRRKK